MHHRISCIGAILYPLKNFVFSLEREEIEMNTKTILGGLLMFRKQNGELEQGHKRKSHGQCVLEYRDQEFIRVLQRLKR